MSYRYSQIDNKNLNWFAKDVTKQSLHGIILDIGTMRGINPCKLKFEYPITAIAGTNGSGKTTILALAACAFHNKKNGYLPPNRKLNYYTFGDFFIQTQGEIGPDGVTISYLINHNNWKGHQEGQGIQTRRKPKGGKWNNYDLRVKRNVVYMGVTRVVPYFERQTHKSYKSHFKPGTLSPETREKIAKLASRVIGKQYSDYDNLEHSKYTIPTVSVSGVQYSGFNMGAGESAVLEILSTLFAAGSGCLLVIDELELGLHHSAQLRFIEVLKDLCQTEKFQIICTTHSYEVLSSIPPEGRIYIENNNKETHVYQGISPEYACGKMGKRNAHEIDIFVEDKVSYNLVNLLLNKELRRRCNIQEIGSSGSLCRHMASRYIDKNFKCLCLFDGDQKKEKDKHKNNIAKYCDGNLASQKNEILEWADNHIDFIPGKEWPEKWIFEKAIFFSTDIVGPWTYSPYKRWGLANDDELKTLLEQSLNEGKHNEFTHLASLVSLSEDIVRNDLICAVIASQPKEIIAITDKM